jgi:hypothetical protein
MRNRSTDMILLAGRDATGRNYEVMVVRRRRKRRLDARRPVRQYPAVGDLDAGTTKQGGNHEAIGVVNLPVGE